MKSDLRYSQYVPAAVLGLFTFINIGRGGIHLFAADGGANSIAGLDLSGDAQTILALFAVIGANQLALGLFQLWVLLRQRSLVVVALGLQTALTALAVLNMHFYRTFPVEVPGKMFNTVLLLLLCATLALTWYWQRREKAS